MNISDDRPTYYYYSLIVVGVVVVVVVVMVVVPRPPPKNPQKFTFFRKNHEKVAKIMILDPKT